MKCYFSAAISICLLSLLIGCRSTGVIPMGENMFMIAKKDSSPGLGVSYKVKAAVLNEANEFAKSKGMEMQVVKVHTMPAKPGKLGSTELTFKCVPKGTPTAAPEREADVIIENRSR
jgi:hypothetical protein